MVWALYAMTLHPEVQERLRAEIKEKITSPNPSQSDLDSLEYFKNFTNEVLRFYPPGMAPDAHGLASDSRLSFSSPKVSSRSSRRLGNRRSSDTQGNSDRGRARCATVQPEYLGPYSRQI